MFEGVVRIDNSDKLKGLYQAARRAQENNDYNNARIYYEKVLEEDPTSWEATFYSRFDSASSYAYIVFNHLEEYYRLALGLIRDNISDTNQQYRAVIQIVSSICSYALDYIATMRGRHNCNKENIQEVLNERRGNFERDYTCIRRGIENAINDTAQVFSDVSIVFDDTRSKFEDVIQALETCKKGYLANEYKYGKSGGCYVATYIYGSYDCPQVWSLRRFRDYTLASTWYGRLFIRTYYAVSPTLVRWFGHTKWFKNFWKVLLDKMVTKLQENGVESTPYQDKEW